MISIEQISEMFGTEKPCHATLTMDEFKACVETSRNMITVDEKVTSDMNMFNIYHIVEPKVGAIGFQNTGTLTLLLNSSQKYYVSLYDRNFVLHSNNPEVVPKSGFTINEKVWAPVYIKVTLRRVYCSGSSFILTFPEGCKTSENEHREESM